MSPGQSKEVVCAAVSFKSAPANFSELNVSVGLQFYSSVILGNSSVQYSKFSVSSLFFWKILLWGGFFYTVEDCIVP